MDRHPVRSSPLFDGVCKGFVDFAPRYFIRDAQHLGRAKEKRFFVSFQNTALSANYRQIMESRETVLATVVTKPARVLRQNFFCLLQGNNLADWSIWIGSVGRKISTSR